jgi:hypothetical protein
VPTGQIKPGSIEAFGMYLQSGILVRFGFAHADRLLPHQTNRWS